MTSPRKYQQGQAATEFLIVSVFILVPLFLIVPLLGKYIDIKHAAIQNARFQAWEYTVWFGDDERIMAGIDASQSAGKKKYKDTIKEGNGYFFSDPTTSSYGKPDTSGLNPLWRDHRGVSLLKIEDVAGEVKEHYTPTPAGLLGEIAEGVLKLVVHVASTFSKSMSHLVGNAQFDVINEKREKGYFKSNVDVTVRSLDQVLPQFSLSAEERKKQDVPLVIKAKAAVQTNNWNAGGRDHATSESRGLVVTSILSPLFTPVNKLLGKINGVFHKLPLSELKLPVPPEFGYVKDDLIPYEHLEGKTKTLQSKAGLYSYER
jgi:hypothetical protein